MPQMGVSVAEGTIVEWRKRPGDWVQADEPVCDVTTDKIDVEIPAPVSGRMERLLVEPGQTVPVGTPLAEIDASARPGQAHPEERGGASRRQTAAEAATTSPTESAANGEADRSRFYSPVVRRVAEKHGIDLSRVEGTGIGGRVRKKDVLALVERQPEDGEPAERPEPVLHSESPYRPEEAERPERPPEPIEASVDELIGPTHREPLSPMRQQIARHMVESRRTAAHCTTVVEVDFSRVAARRR